MVSSFPIVVATGILKGYDQLLNLVLDGTVEHIQGEPSLCVQCSLTMLHSVFFDISLVIASNCHVTARSILRDC